jgi:hypothetical protein
MYLNSTVYERNVFTRSNTGIVGSKPIRRMHVCVLSVDRLIPRSRSANNCVIKFRNSEIILNGNMPESLIQHRRRRRRRRIYAFSQRGRGGEGLTIAL